MEEYPQVNLKKLEKKLGYVFQDKSLLQRALTRESAIQEKVKTAALHSYQGLEFVGDAAIKHAIARILFQKFGAKWTEAMLHDETKRLIGNDDILPKIADKIGLSEFVVVGKGEKTLTQKMKADMLEAVIGAISLDNRKQAALFATIERLWETHLPQLVVENQKSEAKSVGITGSNVNNNNIVIKQEPVKEKNLSSQKTAQKDSAGKVATALIEPLSPRTQRLFTGITSNTTVQQFGEFVKTAPDVNRRNIGKKGDTALIKLMRKEKLKPGNEIPKIELLLKAGASWTVQNNKGETAESIAKKKKHDISGFKPK